MRAALLAAILAWLVLPGCGDSRESVAAGAVVVARGPERGLEGAVERGTEGGHEGGREDGRLSPEAYDEWRRPDRIVAALGLSAGDAVADIGAGTGYLTMRLAEAVGPRGRVTATDVDQAALAALTELARARPAAAAPIDVRRVEPAEPGLEAAAYDRVLLAQVDHLLPDRAAYLRRLRAALAPGGRVAISNRLQHRAGLLRAAAAAGYAVDRDASAELPGQFLFLLAPHPEAHR